MPETETQLSDFDTLYAQTLKSISDFFRFESHHSNAIKFDEDYYARVAAVMKKRIDFELKYLHDPTLS